MFYTWICLTLFVVMAACTTEQPKTPEPGNKSVEQDDQMQVTRVPDIVQSRIQTSVVEERLTPHSLSAPGEVRFDMNKMAHAASRIDGQIEKVFVQLGDRVQRGQALIAIKSMKLDELIENYLVAKVRIDAAKITFQRSKILLREKAISIRRFQDDRTTYLEAKTIHQHVQEKLVHMGITGDELHELEQGSHLEGHHYILKTPMDGTVINQKAVLGQGITAGTKLFRIADTTRVWVFANLPIEEAQYFQKGNEGTIVPKGREPFTAPLTYIASIADEETLTVQVRFDVNNAAGQLKPNEYVEVRLERTPSPVIAIPLSALTIIDGTSGAFVQGDTGFDFVAIETGQESGEWVEVQSGVAIGDIVVTAGVFDLKSIVLRDSISGE